MGSPESAEQSRYFAQFAAFVALSFGLFVLAGWAFDMEQLTNIVPSWPKMVKLTALSFVLAGVSLWLATVDARVPAMGTAASCRMAATDCGSGSRCWFATPPAGTSISNS